jgi:hypothetical protein
VNFIKLNIMNLSEIDVFGNGQQGPDKNGGPEDNGEVDFEEMDCPLVEALENMYLEPHPYGITLSITGTEEILKNIGYRIIEKDGDRYALGANEKLSRNKAKRESQRVIEVYRNEAERLAIARFIKDWKDVFGTTGDSGEA